MNWFTNLGDFIWSSHWINLFHLVVMKGVWKNCMWFEFWVRISFDIFLLGKWSKST
jgi:hypothetical protein